MKLEGFVSQIDQGTFRVQYQVNPDKFHIVSRSGTGLVCECIVHIENKSDCEHIQVVLEKLKMAWDYCYETLRIMERAYLHLCKHCDSGDIVKRGLRKTTKGNIQLFKCRDLVKDLVVILDLNILDIINQILLILLICIVVV